MKPLYPKNKGKVYPSPSPSPSPDAVSVLKLLPAAILALAAILSLEDREVLAYLVTRSLNPTSCVSTVEEKKKWKRMSTHKPPMFDCGCFDCYRSYWYRWDSSPNRELINQAIEAFEDHLNNSEHTPKSKSSSKSSRSKKREEKIAKIEKIHLQQLETPPESPTPAPVAVVEVEEEIPVITDAVVVNLSDYEENEQEDLTTNLTDSPEEVIAVRIPGCSHKGMARKFMPDVLGLFNSRLWNIWNPDI